MCGPLCASACHHVLRRWVLCSMLYLGIIQVFDMRVSMSIAVTELLGKQPSEVQNHSKCSWSANQLVVVKGGRYNLSVFQEAITQFAFFPVYGLADIIGGIFADTYRGKCVVGAGIFLSVIPTTFIAWAMNDTWYAALVTQVLFGIFQGSVFSGIIAILARWIPKCERGTAGGLVFSASHIGYLFAYRTIVYHESWKTALCAGVACLVAWLLLYYLLCYSEPSKHPHISEKEKEMLQKEIGALTRREIPWKSLLRHPGFYGILIGQWGHDYIFFFLADLPKYLKYVFKFNIQEKENLRILPYTGLWISAVASGLISDKLINGDMVTVTCMRKLNSTIALVGPSVCCVVAAYAGCNRTLAAVMFILGMFLMGPYYSGMRVNAMDITLNFCGTITGFANGSGALMYSPIAYWLNSIIKDPLLSYQWRYVVWTIFGMSAVSTIAYLILGSGERAEWDEE